MTSLLPGFRICFQKNLFDLHFGDLRNLPASDAGSSGREVRLQLAHHRLLLARNNLVTDRLRNVVVKIRKIVPSHKTLNFPYIIALILAPILFTVHLSFLAA